jgi:antirestriction protein ArdC
MKHQPTAEQKAKAAERRETFKTLCKTVAGMTEEARAQLSNRMPATNTEGHVLSGTNQMLLAYQRANVTIVTGFIQWKKAGRSVKKGEHGLMIWIPVTHAKDPNKQPGELSTKDTDRPGFIMGTVFDVSQTEEIQQ